MKLHEKVNQWVQLTTEPFDREDATRACGCSSGVVSKALERYFAGRIKCFSRHVGSGNFRTTFFPLTWTDERCWEWIDSKTKTGQSKARLFLFQTSEIKRP